MKPKEKIYEFEVQNRLTSTRKKVITKFFEEHGTKGPVHAKATWDPKNGDVLHIHTFVVEWEVHFSPKLVVVYGSGPMWARFLFTDKKKAQLKQGIHLFLDKAGFFKGSANEKANKTEK